MTKRQPKEVFVLVLVSLSTSQRKTVRIKGRNYEDALLQAQGLLGDDWQVL